MRTICPLICLTLLLHGCSGSSSGPTTSPAPPGGGAQLVIDTAAGSDAVLTARLAAVALELPNGDLGPNLLPSAGAEITLADPLGSAAGAALRAPVAGTYRALRIVLHPGSVRARLANGDVRPVRTPTLDVRVAASQPLAVTARSTLVLRHASGLGLQRRSDDSLDWKPDLVVEPDDRFFVREAHVSVLATNPARRSAVGVLPRVGNRTATFEFGEARELLWNDDDLSPAEFVERLRAGTELIVDGVLVDLQTVRVARARRVERDDDPPGRGNKSRVRGVIESLDHAERAFALRVQTVRKAGRGFPDRRPLELAVRVGDKTKIKWVPRRKRHHRGHLGFDSLRPGMLVDVDWHGPPSDRLVVVAHKVDIRADSRPCRERQLAGRIRSVDVDSGRLVIEATGEPFAFGDARFPTAIAEVDDATVVMRRFGDDDRIVDFGALVAGLTVRITACERAAHRVQALWIRAR